MHSAVRRFGKADVEGALQDEDRDVRAAAVRAIAQGQPNLDTFVPCCHEPRGFQCDVATGGCGGDHKTRGQTIEKFLPVVEPLVKLAANESDRTLAVDTLRSLRIRNVDAIVLAME
jgi:hypothetical protein